MVRGLYTAWTGMANEQKRLDIISNNLANAATVGYKQDNVTNQSFDNVLAIKIRDASEQYYDRPIGTMNLGVKLGEVYTNHEQGSLRETGNAYDLAIAGKGFFNMSVMDKDGNESIQYTRNGSFTLTHDGYIVNADGSRLQGESGDITIPENTAQIVIDGDGSIYADGVNSGKIILTDFDNYDFLSKIGDDLYLPAEGVNSTAADATIQQGFTEQSNVVVVSEMVEMIAITRAYEANQKVIQTVDGTLELAVNSVGKV